MAADAQDAGNPATGMPSARRLGRLAVAPLLALLASVAPGSGGAGAQEVDSRRALYVESAYLVNFLRYSDWSARVEARDAPLVVSVIGDGDIAPAVAAVAAAAGPIQGRRVEVRAVAPRWSRGGEGSENYRDALGKLRASHLVFIDRSAARSVVPTLTALRGEPVLTVANTPRFVERGGMLELFPLGRNIVFAANPEAIQEAGVMLSAKVLKLARSPERGAR